MAVEASLIVVFGDEDSESANLQIELDDQHINNQYTDSDGEVQIYSTFPIDSDPVILIHHDSSIKITNVKCTHGSISKIGQNLSRSREVEGVFVNSEFELDSGYTSISNLSVDFMGNSCSVNIDSTTNSKIVTSSGTYPAFAKCSFNVLFNEQWQLSPPDLSFLDADESYQIYVVVYVESIL